MPIQIISKSQQGQGAFNGGEIVENKPIGFPQDHSLIRPYSSLFYWAHAKAVVDSTIGLHPHQGFEICSFVLKGEIRHYDTHYKEWRPLNAGDVQIIRAGSGISHSEWMSKDGEIFQIWFDPNLIKTMPQPASYDDYKVDQFPITHEGATTITTIVGEGSPMRMDSPGIQVQRLDITEGSYTIQLAPSSMISAYIVEGEALLNGAIVKESDFVLVKDTETVTIETGRSAHIFIIISPVNPGYATYSQLRG